MQWKDAANQLTWHGIATNLECVEKKLTLSTLTFLLMGMVYALRFKGLKKNAISVKCSTIN